MDIDKFFEPYVNAHSPQLLVSVFGSCERQESREYLRDLERCADEGMDGTSPSEGLHHRRAKYAGRIHKITAQHFDRTEVRPLAPISVVSGMVIPETSQSYLFRLHKINKRPSRVVLIGSGSIHVTQGVGMALEQMIELTISADYRPRPDFV